MSMEKAARAGFWSALDLLLRQGVQFVVSVVLARLLSPADFGLIALLTFFTSLSITFVQGGLSLALVQKQDTTREEESAVFWCNLAASCLFGLGLLLIAPAAARLYGQPLLRPLMAVAAAQVVVSALGAVHVELLTRQLRFDRIIRTGVASSVISAAVGVGAALAGWGVWALAWQMLSAATVGTVALWLVSPWRPQLRFRPSAIRELWGFGAFISLSSVLETLYTNGSSLVLGKLYGLADVGLFNRAASIQALPTNIISQVIARTALPLFASRADDKPALVRGFRLATALAMVATTPMLVGLALLSDLVILTLFGPRWATSAPLLSIIALGGIVFPLHVFNLQLLLAIGESRRFFALEVQKKIAGLALIGGGCWFGISGVAYASCLLNAVSLFINTRPTRQLLGLGMLRQLADLRGVFAATLLMAAAVLGLRHLIHARPILELAMLSAAGAAVYLGSGFALRLRGFAEALAAATSVLDRRSPRAAEAG